MNFSSKQVNRPRAIYNKYGGKIDFSNPSQEGPINFVSFCVKDSMYHVNFRPHVPMKEIQNMAEYIRASNKFYNGVAPSIEGTESTRSFWYPGNIDLDDLAPILQPIHNLQADWLQGEVNKLKIKAALNPNDLPFLDRFENAQVTKYGEDGLAQNAWYKRGVVSANGGTIYFHGSTPPELLQTVQTELGKHTSTQVRRLELRGRGLPIFFLWHEPVADAAKTEEKFRTIMSTIDAPILEGGAEQIGISRFNFG